MRIGEIMAVDLVVVRPEQPIADVRRMFAQRRINGAPVIEDGQMLGIVTSTDLMRAAGDDDLPVREVMSRDVVTLTETMTIGEATRVLARAGLHRAPVVRGSSVVGMLTRTDLLRPYLRTDAEISADIEEAISTTLGIRHRDLHARVVDGVVFLDGAVPGRREHELLLRVVSSATGVVDVIDHVRVTPATIVAPGTD